MKKNQLTIQAVKHAAHLASLKLKPKEVIKFRRQLAEILTFFQKLKQLKTTQVLPTSQTTDLKNVFRQDQKKACLIKKEGYFTTQSVTDQWQ